MIDVKLIAKAKKTAESGSGTTTGGGSVGSVAEEAKHAVKADTAEQAAWAEKAGYATKAAWADETGKASRAAEADHAVKADEATHAAEADKAKEAERASYADVANDLTEDSPVNDRFLSAVADDIAHGAITFEEGLTAVKTALLKGGAEFGGYEAGDLWTGGKGAAVDKDGNMEVESLRVRSYMECVELIVNRLSALEGDQLLTEADTIESVTDLGGGLYGLTLREKWDGYHTAQAVGNVVKGIMNTMGSVDVLEDLEDLGGLEAGAEDEADVIDGLEGLGGLEAGAEEAVDTAVETAEHKDSGETGALYFTSWMRVNAVDAAKNYLEVTLYADSEVPGGGNYPPCEMMKIARWGNQTDEKRQECLYLSSTEGRIVKLTGVTKPILEARNYGVTLGSLPGFVKTLTDDNGNALPLREGLDYLYAPGIVTMDVIRLNRWTKKPVVTYVDRGVWQADGVYYCETVNPETGEYETSEVWHKGCKYRCMKNGTTVEPSRTGTEWALVGGYPDLSTTYEMVIDTGGDTLIGNGEEKILTFTVVDGFREDVTGDVLTWTVARDSGDEAADTLWGYEHMDFEGTIAITLDDLRGMDKVTFTVTAYMTDGETAEVEISVK